MNRDRRIPRKRRNNLMRHLILSLIIPACSLCAPTAVHAQACDHWLAGPLHQQTEGLESDQLASASTVWTPPSGPTMLVVGGGFDTAGGVPMNHLAGWDGASWRDLGGGLAGV